MRVLDAHDERAVAVEKVNLHVRGVRDDMTYTTGPDGTFTMDVKKGADISVGTEWRVTCYDKRAKAIPTFSAVDILTRGVVEANTCGKAKTENTPGTITIFTRKATFFENMAR